MKKVSIIGGGLAGLTAGIYLKMNNYDVTIYEKNHYAGGYVTTWMRKNAIIDGCMHWMLGTKDGTDLNKIWKDIDGLGEVIHPESFCVVEYAGMPFHFYMDVNKLEEEFYKYSLNDDEEIKTFIEAIKAIGVAEVPAKVPFELMKPEDFKLDREIIRKCRSYMKISLHELSLRFNSKVIRYALDNNIVNNKFSAYYFIQTIANFCVGNDSLPVGCSKRIQEGVINRYLSLGGKLELKNNVSKIIVEDDKAIGIVANNKEIYSDYVIAACDLHYTEKVLLDGRINTYKEFDNNKEEYPTYSFCIASYRTKKDFGNLDIAYIKEIGEYEIHGFKRDSISIRQYGYDKELINDGYSTVQVYLTTDENDYEIIKRMSKEEYKAFKQELGEFYLSYLNEFYSDKFELIDVCSPLTYERYNNAYKGTFMPYALGVKKQQLIANTRVDGISNLYYGNQWNLMPGGTPIALVSGKFAAQLIMYDDGIDYNV